MNDWFDDIDNFANRTGRDLIRLPTGRGVAFSDGFDVCWLLPGDCLSTLPAPTDEHSASRTIDEIERVDRIRRDVVHVLRHYLASKRYGVILCRSGRWGIQSESGMSSSVCVGAFLTTIARDGGDIASCIAQLLKHSIIRHAPTPRRIQRYLDTPGDPPAERGFEDKTITLGGTSMGSILKLMNLCRAADTLPDEPTEADGHRFANQIEKLEANGPVGTALLRVGERLPDVAPSFELFDNSIVLDFPDGIDGISLRLKSRTLIRDIRNDGPTIAGDRIVDDFERLSRLRTVTLHAIDAATASLGWRIEEARTGLSTNSTVWHVGPDVRNHTIDVGQAMTDSLRNSSPEAYLQRLAVGHGDEFITACLESLHRPAQIKPQSWIALRGRLAPAPPSDVPTLLELADADLIAEADRWAAETLRVFKQSDDLLRKLEDPMLFDRQIDTWLSSTELEAIANSVPIESWFYPQAIRMQLGHGRADAEAKARDLLRRTEGLYEVSGDLIALAWQYRNEFPELVQRSFAPQLHDDVPHAESRATIGDPIAQRYVAAQRVRQGGEDDFTWMEILPLSSRTQSRRECLIEWAKREWRWSVVGTEQFELAIRETWTEVADALDANPHLINALLTWEIRGADGFDMPGLLMAEKLLLGWSRLRPTRLLAKLILTARQVDLVAEGRAADEAAARRNPKIKKKDVAMSFDVMAAWWEQMQPSMAIAWTRWRNYKARPIKS